MAFIPVAFIPPCLLQQEEGDHSLHEWWRIYHPSTKGTFSSLAHFAYVDTRKADGVSHQLFLYPVLPSSTPHVRGGSVSRRGLNQAARNRAQLSGGINSAETTNPNASRSSGERGLGGEALLSEKRPLPPASPTPRLFRREREGGGFSTEKPPPSHPLHSLISFHLQRRGMRGIMQGIMEIKRCYVDSAVSRAIKEDEA